jgi:hypothetical protein
MGGFEGNLGIAGRGGTFGRGEIFVDEMNTLKKGKDGK